MKRKYSNPIQHTIYKDGWNDALKEIGKYIPPPLGFSEIAQDTIFVRYMQKNLKVLRLTEGV